MSENVGTIMRLIDIFFLRTTAAAMLLFGFYLGGVFSVPV